MNELDSVTSVAEYRITGYRVSASEVNHACGDSGNRGVALTAAAAAARRVPEMPADYQTVMSTLGKKGDFKDGVLKVNIPRGDLTVTIARRPRRRRSGSADGWRLTKGAGGADVLMGDLVLTEDEVNPVMSALLDNGLDVTALHNHFFWEQPRIFYMHVHGRGTASELAAKLKPAIASIDAAAKRRRQQLRQRQRWRRRRHRHPQRLPTLDGAALAKIVGHQGEQTGPVYKITIGRPDFDRPRARRDHQRPHGAEYVGGLRRQQRRCDGRGRRRDARTRSDAGAEGRCAPTASTSSRFITT